MTFLFLPSGKSQMVNESTKKKISIGIGEFTDFWLNVPSDVKTRTINQGFTIYSTYNIPFGKSQFSFAIGLGLTVHNMYGNFYVNSYTDSTTFKRINDNVLYKKSKMTVSYLEIPAEFRFKSKSKVTVALGFKAGMLLSSSTKYFGDSITTYNYQVNQDEKTKIKLFGIKNLQQITYGPTLRIGYSWINFYASYMLSTIFKSGTNEPQMYPVSIGIVLMPF
jgi:hypothetical protein